MCTERMFVLHEKAVASLGGGGRTAPCDTLQGGDTRTKKYFVGEFTKNTVLHKRGRTVNFVSIYLS